MKVVWTHIIMDLYGIHPGGDREPVKSQRGQCHDLIGILGKFHRGQDCKQTD